MDTFSKEERSRIMRAVRDRDTKPEMLVRRLVHALGYRFRLHRADLPGKPDLAFIGMKKAVFVHGCFWHGHDCRRGARIPKTNTDYWVRKIERNRTRDAAHRAAYAEMGWSVLVLWECELRDVDAPAARLKAFLDEGRSD